MELDPLTDKERQALRLAKDGATTAQIAQKLHLTEGTIRNYLSSAASKLNAKIVLKQPELLIKMVGSRKITTIKLTF